MSIKDSYSNLPRPLQEQRLDQLTEYYWNLLDQVAEVVAERSVLLELIRVPEVRSTDA